jgi:hypothetical protein
LDNWFGDVKSRDILLNGSPGPSIREKMFVRAEELAPEIRRFVNDYNVLLYEPDAYAIAGLHRCLSF